MALSKEKIREIHKKYKLSVHPDIDEEEAFRILEEIETGRKDTKKQEEEIKNVISRESREWMKSKWADKRLKQGEGPRDYNEIAAIHEKKNKLKTELTRLYHKIYEQKKNLTAEPKPKTS